MRRHFEKIFSLVQISVQKGLLHLMGSTVINKAIGFLTNIVVVRIISKDQYGVLTSAENILAIAALFSGFGIGDGLLYYCSDKQDPEKRKSYYRFAFLYGILTDVLVALAMIVYACEGSIGIEEARPYVFMLALMPFPTFACSYFSVVLRTRKENVKYARLLNINSILYSILCVVGSWFWGITGMVAGRYLSRFAAAAVGFVYCKPYLAGSGSITPLERQERKGILKYSLFCGTTTAMNSILHLIDLALIGAMVSDAEVLASYKVATILPSQMAFIPQSVMIVCLPYFIERSEDAKWIASNTKKVCLSLVAGCGAISVVFCAGAPLIIRLLWGEAYVDAIPCFQILTASFWVLSVFRVTSTNILLALGYTKFCMYVGIFSGIANVILDIVFITSGGSMGAAWATLVASVLAAVCSFPYMLFQIRRRLQKSGRRTIQD